MRDSTEEVLRSRRPPVNARQVVAFCLLQLFRDRKHRLADPVVRGLTFETLIGALIAAEGSIKCGHKSLRVERIQLGERCPVCHLWVTRDGRGFDKPDAAADHSKQLKSGCSIIAKGKGA